MDPKELEKLLKLCQKYGVKALKLPQVELALELDPIPTPHPHQSIAEAPSEPEQALSEEELLLWSTQA